MSSKLGKKGNGSLKAELLAARKARRAGSVTKRKRQQRGGRVLGSIFLGFFLVIGLGLGYFLFGRPLIKVAGAQDWPAVSCVILSSDLDINNSGDGGPTYKIDITYEYEVNGRAYTSDRYDFFSFMHSSGYAGKKEIVDRYQPNTAATCYVDPGDPTSAVISRGLSHNLWFGVIPLVFVLIGGGGLIALFGFGRRGVSRHAATAYARTADASDDQQDYAEHWMPRLALEGQAGSGINHLDSSPAKPNQSRMSKLVTIFCMMLFWNAITGLFLFLVFTGKAPWAVGLFMIPFVLIGIGLVVAVVHQAMTLGNPVVRMKFDRRVIELGNTLRLDWTIDGRAEKFQKLTVVVEATEEATYTRGTDTITDKHVLLSETLYEEEVLDLRTPMPREASAELAIPRDAMHSFRANHNKIVWRVKVHGDIPRWPDVKDEYEFAVVPTKSGPNTRGMF